MKTQQWPQDWKRSVFIAIPKKAMPKNAQTTTQLHPSHLAAAAAQTCKGMLKILQARLLKYVNCEIPVVQAGFRKVEEPEIKLPTSIGSQKKQESSRKPSTLLITPKPLTVWITTNCGKF